MRIYLQLLSLVLIFWLGLFQLAVAQPISLEINGEPVKLYRDHRSLSVCFKEPTLLPEVSAKHAGVSSAMAGGRKTRWTALAWAGKDAEMAPEVALMAAGIDPATVAYTSYGWKNEAGKTFWFDRRIAYRPSLTFGREAAQELLSAFSGAHLGQTPTGLPFVAVSRDEDIIAVTQALQASGLVAWCQPEFRSQASSNTVMSEQQVMDSACAPSDPHFAEQFYVNNTVTSKYPTLTYPYWTPSQSGTDINVLAAWCQSLGSSAITVAVVDEGLEAHEDLEDSAGHSRVVGGYYTDSAYVGNGEPVNPGDAHGQAVAGIVAASHNAVGPSGVAPHISLLGVWIDKGSGGSDLQRADGIRWAYQNGADIILNAWTYDFCTGFASQALEDAIDSAQVYGRGGLGSLVVFSSGYIFEDNDPSCVRYPANLPQVLTVGAIGPGGDLYARNSSSGAGALPPDYAPYGPEIDLVGVSGFSRDISFISALDRMGDLGYNTSSVSYTEYPDRAYTMYFGGTSSAAAQVAGIAALMLDVNSSLSHQQLMNMLTGSAVDVGPTGVDSRFGAGIADASAAVVQAASSPFPVEWGYFAGEAKGEQVRLSWQTLQEINNDRFVIERSHGAGFVAIGEVQGRGNTTKASSYAFFDATPQPGSNVYRLQQVDLDGGISYSKRVEVSYLPQQQTLSSVTPNPARDRFHFEVYGQQREVVYYELTDLQGRVLRQGKAVVDERVHGFSVEVGDVAAGLYFLAVRNDDFALGVRRLIVRP